MAARLNVMLITGNISLVIGLGWCVTTPASASVVPWVGSANYLAAPGAEGDEDVVGPFSGYDFSNLGVVLVKAQTIANPNQVTVGDVYTGYYQSFVVGHSYLGSLAANPNLNTGGTGAGYELTLTASFTQTVTSVVNGNPVFSVDGGQAGLWFDTAPDYNFAGDSGFNDGSRILAGTVVGGGGALVPTVGVGVTSFDLLVSALDFDANVYDPATIAGGTGTIALKIDTTGFTSGVGSVMGNNVGGSDLLLAADGNLALVTVPLPAPLWLLGSSIAGLFTLGNRRRTLVA